MSGGTQHKKIATFTIHEPQARRSPWRSITHALWDGGLRGPSYGR